MKADIVDGLIGYVVVIMNLFHICKVIGHFMFQKS